MSKRELALAECVLDNYQRGIAVSEAVASNTIACLRTALRQATDRAERAERRVAELEGRDNAVDPDWSVDEELRKATGAEGKFRCPWCGERFAPGETMHTFGITMPEGYTKPTGGFYHEKCFPRQKITSSILPPSSESTDG